MVIIMFNHQFDIINITEATIDLLLELLVHVDIFLSRGKIEIMDIKNIMADDNTPDRI